MNLSIKTKLIIGFTVILVALGTLSFIMMSKLSETNQRLNNIVNYSSKKVNLSNEIMIGVLDVTRHEKNIILEMDPIKMNLFKDKINESVARVDRLMPQLFDMLDAEGKKSLYEFKLLWNDYKSRIDEIIVLALKYENAKATELSINKGVKNKDDILSILNWLIEKNNLGIEKDKKISDEIYNSSYNLILLFIFMSVSVAVIIAYWITNTISKRIKLIANEAEKIASREIQSQDIQDSVKDELNPVYSSLININKSFREVTDHADKVASGNYGLKFIPKSEKDILGNALDKMTISLKKSNDELTTNAWFTTGQNQINEKMRGDQGIDELANNIITFLSEYVSADIGAFYVINESDRSLYLSGKYAFYSIKESEKFEQGCGIIGQAAQEQKELFISDLTEDQVSVISAVTNAKPSYLMIVPILFQGNTLGVIEIGKLKNFAETEQEFLRSCAESIGISINSAKARKLIQELLEETQVQSEELQNQQEELRQINEELEEQTQNLKVQQEELQMTNEELEEQAQALESKNKEVENARLEIEKKSRQLEITGKYKSEFLANMSHELRTPLNSLLILSKDLYDNKKRNLTSEQVESAEIIYKSGSDLLTLINEVLDLSKIEAGKMTLNPERISLRSVINDIFREFKFQAEKKGLITSVNYSDNLPEYVFCDQQRLGQILKNLLSNAIKFTEKGSVIIDVQHYSKDNFSISVRDTGIGIAQEQQMAIFEAFHQADGGTSRKYGGTGLGLSISRELANLLDGEIKLASELNKGSVFTLILPYEIQKRMTRPSSPDAGQFEMARNMNNSEFINHPTIEDERGNINIGDKIVLITDDDLRFAEILKKQANEKGFKCLAASTGEDALILAEKYKPNAIILDLDLPGMTGYQVLNNLKANPALRHIPVHIISVNERKLDLINQGAVEYLTKPVNKKQLEDAFNRIENLVSRKMKNLLIIEDDKNSRVAIKRLIGESDVAFLEAESGEVALNICNDNIIDCIVLDIGLPDMNGFKFIEELDKQKNGQIPPVIVYTGKELTKEEDYELQKYAESIIIKGVKSEERLLDETALFLHRTISNLPEPKKKIITTLYDKEAIFKSKKILLVDDDMRNVFALSKILKNRGMEIIKAENGLVALEALDKNSEVDLVLMDIMMPEMDGYEATRKIKENPKYSSLPVIALTAKAMKDDRKKCIEAGANDYITKPVDVERLLSLMSVWLSK